MARRGMFGTGGGNGAIQKLTDEESRAIDERREPDTALVERQRTEATNDVPLAKRLHDLALETADDGLCNLLADAAAAVRERDAIINAWGVRYDWTPEGMKAAHAGDFVPWLHLWKAWDSAND